MNDVERWFQEERGIKPETLERWSVEVEGDKAFFPYARDGASGEIVGKFRTGFQAGAHRKFWFSPGIPLSLYGAARAPDRRVVFLVEGESDAMRLEQELVETGADLDEIAVYGIPGVETFQHEWADLLTGAVNVFVILDNEEDYRIAERVENGWRSIREAVGKRAKRVVLPKNVKDICEFFVYYDLDHLRSLANAHAPRHYKPLDLSAPVPPTKWLIDGLIAEGDFMVMIGEPGVGKSMLAMSLAVAVSEERDDWLGFKIRRGTSGVLYIDEENPEDVARQRLSSFGLTERGQGRLEYWYRQGVRVDKHPDWLLEDALIVAPSLIVIDSMIRVHREDENSSALSGMMSDGFLTLARETGASVLLLHHVNKTDSPSSFRRQRGSGDISGIIDGGLDVRSTGLGNIAVARYKSRRSEDGDAFYATIESTAEGVRVRRADSALPDVF